MISESGTFNVQTNPDGAKVASTRPLNWSRARKNNLVPKPRWLGGRTTGPPLSRHSTFNLPLEIDHSIDIVPVELENAPYFAALVASS
jgi:hypothetical protein